MALNPALKQLIDTKLAHARAPQWELPIAEVRAAFRNLWTPAITGNAVSISRVEDVSIPGADANIPARLYVPEGPKPAPVILYLHGGGYVKGGIEDSDAFCRNLAHVTRHIVLSIGYRLAPEHPFPAALDDALTAVVWAGAHAGELGGMAGSVIVCGESAGGNLATVACGLLRSDSRVAIRYQVLLQPVVDFTLSFPSIAMPPTECLVPRDDLACTTAPIGQPVCPQRSARSPIYAQDLPLPPRSSPPNTTAARRSGSPCRASGARGGPTCFLGERHGARLRRGGLVREAEIATEEIARY
jgi:acetyl esterase